MKTRTIQLLFFFALTSSTAFGANYFTLYKERTAGAEQYSWIDPVIDSSGELVGFVYCDATNKKLIIHTSTLNREISVPGPPQTSINRLISADSLIVYYLYLDYKWYSYTDWLGRAVVMNDTVVTFDTLPPIPYDWYATMNTDYRKLRMLTNEEQPMNGLLFELITTYSWYDATQGPSSETVAFAVLFDETLHSFHWKDGFINVLFGKFSGNDSLAYCGFQNNRSFLDWRDGPDDTYHYYDRQNTHSVIKYNPADPPLFDWNDVNSNSINLFAGDFRTDYPLDEIIYYGDPKVAGVTAPGHGYVAACYSFASGQRQILWYNYEDRWDTLSFWYQDGQVIAGTRGDNVAVFLNARTGIPGDSVVFPHDISNFRYFETGTNPKQLNFVGRVFDTVIVYQFDEITEVEEPQEATLPTQFFLSQNYPNPFNPTTTIEFEVPRRASVNLIIYNTLGQHVRTLVNESLPAGNYSRTWDGKSDAGKPVSSGVYFYQVSGDAFSQSKKMILLK